MRRDVGKECFLEIDMHINQSCLLHQFTLPYKTKSFDWKMEEKRHKMVDLFFDKMHKMMSCYKR